MTKSYLKDLTYQVNSAAIEVHQLLGPGLLESVYHTCFEKDLMDRGISFQSQLSVPIEFKGVELETDLNCDLFIENCIVVELEAIESITPIHHSQLLTNMKLLRAPIGILFNFNTVNLFGEGQRTFVNEYYRSLGNSF